MLGELECSGAQKQPQTSASLRCVIVKECQVAASGRFYVCHAASCSAHILSYVGLHMHTERRVRCRSHLVYFFGPTFRANAAVNMADICLRNLCEHKERPVSSRHEAMRSKNANAHASQNALRNRNKATWPCVMSKLAARLLAAVLNDEMRMAVNEIAS